MRFFAFLGMVVHLEACVYGTPDDVGARSEDLAVAEIQCTTLAVQWWSGDRLRATQPACFSAVSQVDHNCDGELNVVDIVLATQLAHGAPLSPELDGDMNGLVDACEPEPETDDPWNWIGDANCDGESNFGDALCVAKVANSNQDGLPMPTCFCGMESTYDVDCDGSVESDDLFGMVYLLDAGVELDENGNGIADVCE